jgi:hypothetical protein
MKRIADIGSNEAEHTIIDVHACFNLMAPPLIQISLPSVVAKKFYHLHIKHMQRVKIFPAPSHA